MANNQIETNRRNVNNADDLLENGCVYLLHCIPTDKYYVGQTVEWKYNEHGIIYYFGAEGRFRSQVSEANSTGKTVPLLQAIREHGRQSFTIQVLALGLISELDAIETKYIEEYDTVYPNGYNVASHGRKVGASDNLAIYFVDKTQRIHIHAWKRDGKLQVVAVYLVLNDGEEKRFCFGSGINNTFENALLEMKVFIKPFEEANIPIEYDSTMIFDNPSAKYQETIDMLNKMSITRVLITTRTSEVQGKRNIILYVSTKELTQMRSRPKSMMVSTTKMGIEEAHKVTKAILERLNTSQAEIEDKIGLQLERNLNQRLENLNLQENIIAQEVLSNVGNRQPRPKLVIIRGTENGVNSPGQPNITA